MERVVDGQWTPAWWEPRITPGSPFFFAARLHHLTPGAITGGALWLDGREFPVSVSQGTLRMTVPGDRTAELAHGGSARVYLDTAEVGRVLWLDGTITSDRRTP